jgi:hypothetical protein
MDQVVQHRLAIGIERPDPGGVELGDAGYKQHQRWLLWLGFIFKSREACSMRMHFDICAIFITLTAIAFIRHSPDERPDASTVN